MKDFVILGEKSFLAGAISIGVLILLICIVYAPANTFILFPIFVFTLFLYHYKRSQKFSALFLAYLVSAMLSEIGFIYDFVKYINWVSLFNITAQILLILLLKPLLKFKIKDFSTHNIVEVIIGFLGISYVLGYILYMIFPLIPDLTLFIPSVISFLFIVAICIAIPLFNKHPRNIFLWGVGGGLLLEMLSAFIYEFLNNDKGLIIASFTFALFLKIVLAIYLTKIDQVLTSVDNEYI